MVAQDTAEVLVEAKDVVEDAVDILGDRVSWIVRNPSKVAILAGTTGVLFGALASFLVVNSRVKAKYKKIADEEIADIKAHYSIPKIMNEPKPGLDTLAAKYDAEETEAVEEVLQAEGYLPYDKVEPVTEEVKATITEVVEKKTVVEATSPTTSNIFDSDDPDTYWDWEEEKKKREDNPDDPYLITADEFRENAQDHENITLTYFDGDGVLVDDRDQPVNDETSLVGTDSLVRFGHGSNDKNVVYVRNNHLKVDFEILYSDKKYAEDVLGFIQHSDTNRVRKFRNYD